MIMYLHLGSGFVVRSESVIGVFDLDVTSQSRTTRDFLAAAEKAGAVVNAAEDLPKSFVVCGDKDGERVYLSQMSSKTLFKRACQQSADGLL